MLRIIVEGNDDKKFIINLLNHLKKEGEIVKKEDFNKYITTFGGKSKLLDKDNIKYKNLSKQLGLKFKKVLFIFDCDFEKDNKICNGMENSKKCFEELKRELNWNIPIDYYIFDKNLDYFLIKTIKDKECYNHFDDLVESLGIEKLKPNKKPIANLYTDLYPSPHFDFSHSNFEELKTKLKALFR